MHYHVILTELCNSRCRYCYGKSLNEFNNDLSKRFKFDLNVPERSKVNVNLLKKFIEKDENPILIFYGGEPLLEIKKIQEIMDKINVPYRMQTNGKLLDKLPMIYLKHIGKILVSIDGTKQRTDYNRGKGTYDRVMSNIKQIKSNGYKGEIIARMTLSYPDVFEQVKHLLRVGFSSIHWQLDAGFYRNDFDYATFKKFVKVYNNSITKLVSFWVREMSKGKVLRLYPFIGITEDLLLNRKTMLRCGAGHSGYAISTDGKIVACPIMNGIKTFIAGNIKTNPKDLKRFRITGRCIKCELKNICGGRCLYWNRAKLWPDDGDDLICLTIKHLINQLKKSLSRIESLISERRINLNQFNHEKYFGPEIIP